MSPSLEGWGEKADTGACGGHHVQPEEPTCAWSQSLGRLDGSRLGKPTSRCVQHAAIMLYLCSKGLTCVVQHHGFTLQATSFLQASLFSSVTWEGRWEVLSTAWTAQWGGEGERPPPPLLWGPVLTQHSPNAG